MPFDGNKWNHRKMVPYAEMIDLVCSRYPDLIRLTDGANDTSKVSSFLLHMLLFYFSYHVLVDLRGVMHCTLYSVC